MKKNYFKPSFKAVKIETTQILAGSTIQIKDGEGDPKITDPSVIQSRQSSMWEDEEY